MGLLFTGDEYCRRTDAFLGHLPRLHRVMDDMLCEADDLQACYDDARNLLLACREHNITLGKKKFTFASAEVKFAGYVISDTGVKSDPAKLDAITRFPKPTNITEMRSFFGLVNQLSDFSPDIAAAATPLRSLLRQGDPFLWTPDHDEAFEKVKRVLTAPPVLAHFDPLADSELMTDASRKHRLGYILTQIQQGHRRLIQCGSRFVTDTESRYSATEIELCAVQWAMGKCRLFLLGSPKTFKLIVDHQALVTILDRQTLDAVENPRLQRMKERLMQFHFTTIWNKGKSHAIPDALSRAPVSEPSTDDMDDHPSISHHIRAVWRGKAAELSTNNDSPEPVIAVADPLLESLRASGSADPDYVILLQTVQRGFPPNIEKTHVAVRPYWKVRIELSFYEGLVLKGSKIVIPKSQRLATLSRLHASHQGTRRTVSRARQLVFCPGITNDIATTVDACEACQIASPSRPNEPMITEILPTYSFQDVSIDIFNHAGNHYLVYVDRLSNYPIIDACLNRDMKTRDVTSALRRTFAYFGIPARIRTDGGPQFASAEFQNFAKEWEFNHVMSSPHYPQSNGHAEAAVKAMKNLLKKSSPSGQLDSDLYLRGLLEWRNTPGTDGQSPAQILFGRQLRSHIPAHDSVFIPPWQTTMEHRNNRRREEREDTKLRVQDHTTKLWDKQGIIISIGKNRDYRIEMTSGRKLWRNRKFVKLDHTPSADTIPDIPMKPVFNTPQPKDPLPRRRRRRASPNTEPPRRSSRLAGGR